jgi:hypothetical protein
MKKLKFKLWLWFVPIVGIIYLIWYGYVVVIQKKHKDGMNDLNIDRIGFYHILFVLYATVHIYSIAFLIAWILSLIGVI